MDAKVVDMTSPVGEGIPGASRLETTPSSAVAERIREARRRRGWSASELADQCSQAGFPITKAVLANIESGRPNPDGTRRRDVTVDELLAFAAVLDVAPVYLMGLPDGSHGVRITESTVVTNRDELLMWIRGDQPLPGADARLYLTAALEQLPAVDSAQVIDQLRRAVLQDRARELTAQFNATAASIAADANTEVEKVIANVGAALAKGATVEDVLGLLRTASAQLEARAASLVDVDTTS